MAGRQRGAAQCRARGRVALIGLLAAVAGCASVMPAPAPVRVRCANAVQATLEWSATSPRGTFHVWRDGRLLAKVNATTYTDASVLPARRYDYQVSRAQSWWHEVRSGALSVTTPDAAPHGDPPYCPSRRIHSLRWRWDEGSNQAPGSDLWSVTWGADGLVYAFFGDGGGFGGTDTLGRTSFGIARLSGPSPLIGINIYGGYQGLFPAALSGKASSIAAIGADFYALGGIYRAGERSSGSAPGRSGSPDRVELAYSLGDSHSWHVASWYFCRSHSAGGAGSAGAFCPQFFVAYGPGNMGAPGGYVYVVGSANSEVFWHDVPAAGPAHSYLARVRPRELLRQGAYDYFAGLDGRGQPRWSRHISSMRPIFSDGNPDRAGCGGVCAMASGLADAAYVPELHAYIAVAQGRYAAQTSVYEAAELWGPWSLVAYDNLDPGSGEGGWAGLGLAGGDALGVNLVNAWTRADGRHLWVTYSSNGVAPAQAAFPPPGTIMDSFNAVGFDLLPTGKEAE